MIQLEETITEFSEKWIRVAGIDGQTTYFHYIVSGHVVYFARKYKNYHRFSQQGWEALNARMKTYFLHHTQKAGEGARHRSYLVSIYKYFQRSFAWRTGLGDQYFLAKKSGGPNDNSTPALLDAVAAVFEV